MTKRLTSEEKAARAELRRHAKAQAKRGHRPTRNVNGIEYDVNSRGMWLRVSMRHCDEATNMKNHSVLRRQPKYFLWKKREDEAMAVFVAGAVRR